MNEINPNFNKWEWKKVIMKIKFIYLFVIFLNMVIETWEKDVLNLLRKDKRGIYIYIGEKLTIGFDL